MWLSWITTQVDIHATDGTLYLEFVVSGCFATNPARINWLFQAFPIVFQQERGWSAGIGGLAFIPIGVGMVIAVALVFWFNAQYVKTANKPGNGGFAPPEARLLMAMLGGCLLPIGVSPFFHFSICMCPDCTPSFSGLRE